MTQAASLSLKLKEYDGQAVLYACGEIDVTTAAIFADALAGLSAGDVVVDMSGITFIDSSGLHALVSTSYTLAASHRRVIIRRPHQVVYRAIEVAGLLARFTFQS